ncbi:MAG: helix-turn-helix transcriptional regulator [Oscillibacter sp.]|jgi:transcriptional regulator with XRE-family HTH domain|nr:helix-turn-helix transcriptional regulator [Oscillibacter sp.]MCI8689465.1 helix-turn-helix transcriptional regulator [Oscillibacter sp.]MCI9481793.1 helix-turn-helix transcriptional regulator [Oscillibacter sp.]
MSFTEKLRLLRKERGLTQADVGAEVGLSTRGYQDIELGSMPRYNTLLRLAEFYDVSLDWLADRTEKREINR